MKKKSNQNSGSKRCWTHSTVVYSCASPWSEYSIILYMKLFTLELFVDAKLLQMTRLHLAYDVSTHRLPVSPLSYGLCVAVATAV